MNEAQTRYDNYPISTLKCTERKQMIFNFKNEGKVSIANSYVILFMKNLKLKRAVLSRIFHGRCWIKYPGTYLLPHKQPSLKSPASMLALEWGICRMVTSNSKVTRHKKSPNKLRLFTNF